MAEATQPAPVTAKALGATTDVSPVKQVDPFGVNDPDAQALGGDPEAESPPEMTEEEKELQHRRDEVRAKQAELDKAQAELNVEKAELGLVEQPQMVHPSTHADFGRRGGTFRSAKYGDRDELRQPESRSGPAVHELPEDERGGTERVGDAGVRG